MDSDVARILRDHPCGIAKVDREFDIDLRQFCGCELSRGDKQILPESLVVECLRIYRAHPRIDRRCRLERVQDDDLRVYRRAIESTKGATASSRWENSIGKRMVSHLNIGFCLWFG